MKRLKWKLGSVSLEIVLIFRCKIGARIAWYVPYASKYIWKHPIELLVDVCYIESHFGLFGDSVSFGAR